MYFLFFIKLVFKLSPDFKWSEAVCFQLWNKIYIRQIGSSTLTIQIVIIWFGYFVEVKSQVFTNVFNKTHNFVL